MRERSSNSAESRRNPPNLLDQALGQVEALQHELDSLREQLARENRLETLGSLAAGLAHETNNLLTPIGSYAQLALGDPENIELAHKALRIAAEGAAKIGRLNASALGMLSPTGGTSQHTCQADAVVNETIHMLKPVLQRERIAVAIDVPVCRIQIDALALQQVLINLINNARHAMREHLGNHRIAINALENKGNMVIRVSDNGPGIPEEVRAHLFESFATSQRTPADNTSDTPDHSDASGRKRQASSGTGLGLSICRQLIESAGGQISLEAAADSEPEGGTTFRIELPIRADATD